MDEAEELRARGDDHAPTDCGGEERVAPIAVPNAPAHVGEQAEAGNRKEHAETADRGYGAWLIVAA